MPISFWIFLVVAVLGVLATIAAAVGTTRKDDPNRGRVVIGTAFVFGLIAGAFLFSASATVVPTRSVGVEVALGKPVRQLDNGFHLINPLHKVEKFDTRKQTIVMHGDGKDADAPCVNVRLGNQTTACVDVNRAQWNINPDGDVIGLYRQFKSFDSIEHSVVQGQIQNGLINTLSSFNPLANVNADGTVSNTPVKTTDQLSTDALSTAQNEITKAVGDGVKLDLLQIFVNYEATTQQKLDDYAKSIGETRIAHQNGLTAAENAKANKALTESGAAYKDPGVQYQNCLNLVRDLAARNQLSQLPPTFNCGDPRSPVIVQAPK